VRVVLCDSADVILKEESVTIFVVSLLPALKMSYTGRAAPRSESGFVLTRWTTWFHLPLFELETISDSRYGWDKPKNCIKCSRWILEYRNSLEKILLRVISDMATHWN